MAVCIPKSRFGWCAVLVVGVCVASYAAVITTLFLMSGAVEQPPFSNLEPSSSRTSAVGAALRRAASESAELRTASAPMMAQNPSPCPTLPPTSWDLPPPAGAAEVAPSPPPQQKQLRRQAHSASPDDPEILILSYVGPWGAALGEETFSPSMAYPKHCAVPCRRTSDRSALDKADAVMFHGPGLSPDKLRIEKRNGQKWVMTGQESAGYYSTLDQSGKHIRDHMDVVQSYQLGIRNPAFLKKGANASDLFHLQYSKWINPAGYWSNYEYGDFAHRRPEMYAKGGLALWMHNNCNSQSKREDVVAVLMDLMPIDSVGRCLHNYSPKDNAQHSSATNLVAKYKFYLSFENVFGDPDWVSSTYFRVLDAGAIPVYLGAPNIGKFAPSAKAVIRAYDFPSPEALVDYLFYLDANDTAYRERLSWKEEGPSPEFLMLMQLADIHSDCRLCTLLAYDRKSEFDTATQVAIDHFVTFYDRWARLNARLDEREDRGTGDVLAGAVRPLRTPPAWKTALANHKHSKAKQGWFPAGGSLTHSAAGSWRAYVQQQRQKHGSVPSWAKAMGNASPDETLREKSHEHVSSEKETPRAAGSAGEGAKPSTAASAPDSPWTLFRGQ